MSQTARPVPGQRYRHFKGNQYQIITIGLHSETGEEMVVYQALYGDYQVYIRPLNMFLDVVDKEKYPEAEQETRFQLITDNSGTPIASENTGTMSKQAVNRAGLDESTVSPLLIQFLDADTYTKKLKIFLEMRESIDEIMLTDVAASLDISTGAGTLEEQYASVQYALHTLAKYERTKR